MQLQIDTTQAVGYVDPGYVSYALDTSVVLGGSWWDPRGQVEGAIGQTRVPPLDLDSPRLRRLARALAPAYLRIGGSEADKVYYHLDPGPAPPLPAGYSLILTRQRWQQILDFSQASGARLMFTLNAGPGPRNAQQEWQPAQSAALLRHVAQQHQQVAVWELGNEINGYPLLHGLWLSGAAYARDFARLRTLRQQYTPQTRLAGPASAYWPLLGEPFAVQPDFLAAGGQELDILSWHYYPQQSRRCPVATRRASAETLLDPQALDTVSDIATGIRRQWEQRAYQSEMWLGETGHAQCGGEPGISDRYVSGLWWLDQLGQMALQQQKVVIRQSLLGSDYGLLRPGDLQPRPDYWNTLLWKRLMGETVLRVQSDPAVPELRTYAHCSRTGVGDVTLLLINLSHQPQTVSWGQTLAVSLYQLGSSELLSPELVLNGHPLALTPDDRVPAFTPRRAQTSQLTLPPQSYAFVRLPLQARMCVGPPR